MSFNLYGFIVGIAVIVGYLLAEKKAIQHGIKEKTFFKNFFYIFLAGVFGARAWHVITDFYLYKENLIETLYIWNGGLSILGAVLGGLIALYFLEKNKENLKIYLDSIVFGLPIAQLIGRWANFVNQEIYGLPTNLPWKIFIDLKHRVSGFEEFKYFHPLFFYEGVLVMAAFLIMSFLLKKKIWKIGEGRFFVFYLAYYGIIRFFLDFLRIDGTNWYGLGVNQWVILILELLFISWLVFKHEKKTKKT
jgi:phosphatidylglycerol---prolipoprotein diacylglyceryl transferase